jgi:hypothetical protein
MNNNEKIILVFIILIFFCIILSNTNFFELFNTSDIKIDLVISRYSEDIKFLKEDYFNDFNIIIYNKGSPIEDPCIKLDNIGRESHTYLHHIVANYDNLANVICFLPGSCMDHTFDKKIKTYKTLDLVKQTKKTVFVGGYVNGRDIYNFKLDEWESTNQNNKEKTDTHKLKKCFSQPFGTWYENNFPNVELRFITWNGIFAVSKKHILQHSKEYYEKLLMQLSDSSNPECGHYFERAWVSVFERIPDDCLHNR